MFFSLSGTREMRIASQCCLFAMAFSFYLSRKIRRPLGWACFDPVCFGKLCFPTEASPADRAANAVFRLPVKEKTPPEASTCLKPQRQGGGGYYAGGLQPFSLCLSMKRQSRKLFLADGVSSVGRALGRFPALRNGLFLDRQREKGWSPPE